MWKEEEPKQIILTIGLTKANVYGEPKYNDVSPKIKNGRTMLPARFVAENLVAEVAWSGSKMCVAVTGDNGTVIEIYIDSSIAYVNGGAVQLDSPAFIENGRTYTPVRFNCENLGASVEWNESEQKVTINKKG